MSLQTPFYSIHMTKSLLLNLEDDTESRYSGLTPDNEDSFPMVDIMKLAGKVHT